MSQRIAQVSLLLVLAGAAGVPLLLSKPVISARELVRDRDRIVAELQRSEQAPAVSRPALPAAGDATTWVVESLQLKPRRAAGDPRVVFEHARPSGDGAVAAVESPTGAGSKRADRGAGSGGELLAPVDRNAGMHESGVLLQWSDHPAIERGSVLRSHLYRWTDVTQPEHLFESDPYLVDIQYGNPPSRKHEYLDTNVCEGIRYFYAVRTIQLDRVAGVEIRRSSLSERVICDVPVRHVFESVAFLDGAGAPVLDGPGKTSEKAGAGRRFRMLVTDLREQKPTPVPVDLSVGGALDVGAPAGRTTGFKLADVSIEAREESVEFTVPVFEADGSRKIEGGKPVFESRTETRTRTYPVVTVEDRCGQRRVVRVPAKR